MDLTGNATAIAAMLAAIAPATALVTKAFELCLASKKQQHEIERARADQDHAITTGYLDRALDPETPLAIRDALLRFLATNANKEERLQVWARKELDAVETLLKPFEKGIAEARAALDSAQDRAAFAAAEARLRLALDKKQALQAPPRAVPATAAALRAGFFSNNKTLSGISMAGENLQGATLDYTVMAGGNFAGADLREASMQGADLRGATMVGANIVRASLLLADCRGADFSNAILVNSRLDRARVEGANFTGADLRGARMSVVYDATTIWPDGFDADAAGAVRGDPAASPVEVDERFINTRSD